ncbi:MAG: ankyrin repeat domain-containing protein [Armatimonadota bacterium]
MSSPCCYHGGADVNVQSLRGDTPLHFASVHGEEGIVRILLEHGADATVESADGNTPLHLTADEHWVDIGTLLLAHGADPNVKNAYGMTPRQYAECGRECLA